jgi:hypothetical protein
VSFLLLVDGVSTLLLAGAAPSFTGLIDVLGVSATRAYSTRRLAGAYAGSAIRIRRSSDNAEQDIGFVGEDLDTATVATFVGANSAFVTKWYDQSGSADDCVAPTVANQARIVNAGVLDVRNGKAAPLFYSAAVISKYFNAVVSGIKTAGAVVATTEAGPNATDFRGVLSNGSANLIVENNGSPNWFTGSLGTPIVDNVGAGIVFGGVLSNVRVTSATGIGATDTQVIGRQTTIDSRYWPGWIGEVVSFATQLSAPNYAALYTNQKTYWGTP